MPLRVRLQLVLTLGLAACGEPTGAWPDAAWAIADAAAAGDIGTAVPDGGEASSFDAALAPLDASVAGPDAAAIDPCERDGRYSDERCDLDCARPDLDCNFGIVGHRGSTYRRTENTLPSYQLAMEEGANALEIDVCRTLDGQAVIWHDRDPDAVDALAREAGLEGLPWRPWVPDLGDPWRRPVDSLTLEELREHYGYAFTSTGQKDATAVVPTFADFAVWASSAAHLKQVYVDVKVVDENQAHDLALQLADVAAGSRYQLFLMSPSEATVAKMKATLDQEGVGHAARIIFDFEGPGALAGARKLGLDALSTGKPPTRALGEFLTELKDIVAHRDEPPRLDPIVAWTFDADADLVSVLQAGADAILSNRPADLGRQVFRGYDDHRRLAQAATECWQAHPGGTSKAMCADGAALKLFAPMREEQVSDWVCSDPAASFEMQDLFGCGLLLDSEVVFRGAPEKVADVAVWYEPPAGSGAEATIVVGSAADFQ
jgi:glycerophosphoryl diester phosphodiesterase